MIFLSSDYVNEMARPLVIASDQTRGGEIASSASKAGLLAMTRNKVIASDRRERSNLTHILELTLKTEIALLRSQ